MENATNETQDSLYAMLYTGQICPYCQGKTEYVDSEYIYGKSYGMVYICKPCDAYVGVHKGTDKALGRLANKSLREAKKQAHAHFDPMWKRAVQSGRKKHEARNSAYKWLAEKMGIDREFCHIGMMDESGCTEVVKICKPYLTCV